MAAVGIGDYFAVCKEKNTIVKEIFNRVDYVSGKLRGVHKDYKIEVAIKELIPNVDESDYKRIAGRFINNPIELLVKSVDEENKRVVFTKRGLHQGKETPKIDAITKRLEAGEEIIYDATVKQIFTSGEHEYVVVGFEGGLRGIIYQREWSPIYVSKLSEVTKIGQKFKVKVLQRNEGASWCDFVCSRKAVLSDPWPTVKEELHRDDVVTCKVIQEWNGGYSGVIEGFEDVKTYVERPTERADFRMVKGLCYYCKVSGIQEAAKTIRLRPTGLCYIGKGVVQNNGNSKKSNADS